MIQSTGLFFFNEIDIPVVKAMRGGRWRAARAVKSCVKPLATADVFNPAVREWSAQIGIHTKEKKNWLDFPTNCVLQRCRIKFRGREKGEAGSPLCSVAVAECRGVNIWAAHSRVKLFIPQHFLETIFALHITGINRSNPPIEQRGLGNIPLYIPY